MTSIETVQARLDELLLAVFNASVAPGTPDSTVTASFEKIKEKYDATVSAVDELDGIDVTDEQQKATIMELNADYEEGSKRVLALREELLALEMKVKDEIVGRVQHAGLERTEDG